MSRQARRCWWVRRVVTITVLCLALVGAAPSTDLVDAIPGGWPLGWLRTTLSSLAWADSLVTPPLPVQETGTANNASHYVDGDETSAGAGAGKAPGTAEGALPADDAEQATSTPSLTGSASSDEAFDPDTSDRIESAATETSDVYLNEDGSYTRSISETPVNYEASDGTWRPIDPTVTAGDDGRLHAGENSFTLTFGPLASDPRLVAVSTPEGYSMSYSLAGAAAAPASISGPKVTYAGALAGTDLVLTTLTTGVKEELILAAPGGPTSWVFPLTLDGLTPRITDQGGIEFLDPTGAVRLAAPLGTMHDSNINPESGDPAQSSAIVYDLVTLDDGSTAMRVGADAAWLNDPARVYPVTIDPSVTQNATDSTYLSSTYDGPHDTESFLKIGTWNGTEKARSFLKFDAFATTFDGAKITSAKLKLFNTWSYNCTAQPFSIYRVTSSWKASTLKDWSTQQPTLSDNTIGGTTTDPGDACTNTSGSTSVGTWMTVSLGLTTFNDWATGDANNGLAITASLTDKTQWKKFCSTWCTNSPKLLITYTPNAAPQINSQYPGFGYSASTLTPQLLASASDDGWPSALTYNFQVFDQNAKKIAESGKISTPSWTIPAGKLTWGGSYSWTVVAYDGHSVSSSQTTNLLTTAVPQPAVTSGLAQNGGQGFEQSIGNYTTTATDAVVATVGPALAIQRAYNSLDPRTTSAFGTGWSTVVDM
ncbi:MAG: DNRLRE domain-containing protein, partial [Micromonosporaceae bacterium]|nr:DNRLRE domain-containing protein [Micromonosporaceae bacterium]